MNELLTINNDTQTVSARELHEKLEIKSKYADWFKNMISYGFYENTDFKTISKNLENGGRTIEHEITLDMAKQICMIQRTPQGKAVRQYLIDLEKAWNTPEQVFARALKMADETINRLKVENTSLVAENDRMKPKEIFADAVTTSDQEILIGDLAKILKGNGIEIGAKRLFKWLRDNDYLNTRGDSYNMPSQKSMNLGLFKVRESTTINPDGSIRLNKTTKVTGKGQVYFTNKFLSSKEVY